jgi:hypothetical protein
MVISIDAADRASDLGHGIQHRRGSDRFQTDRALRAGAKSKK